MPGIFGIEARGLHRHQFLTNRFHALFLRGDREPFGDRVPDVLARFVASLPLRPAARQRRTLHRPAFRGFIEENAVLHAISIATYPAARKRALRAPPAFVALYSPIVSRCAARLGGRFSR